MKSFFKPWLAGMAFLGAAGVQGAPVRIDSGLVEGATGRQPGVMAYKGIPFAKPPVGELRWKAPQPAESWSGVRRAADYGAVCPHPPLPDNHLFFPGGLGAESEDCLSLNVWTKAGSRNQPVFVYVHGGGYRFGSGAERLYQGDSLASQGTVVVTINYRLGVFGFLAHPELSQESGAVSGKYGSGNYGLMDQLAALQWVKRNIAAFGGNPGNVTLIGESAGAFSTSFLLASPLSKGLFQRAIMESGASFDRNLSLADAEAAGKRLIDANGGTIKAARSLPVAQLVKAGGAERFNANLDNYVLPRDVYSVYRDGAQVDVPILIGSNANEGTPYPPFGGGTLAGFTGAARKVFGERADRFFAAYPVSNDAEARETGFGIMRDQVFGWNMWTLARMQAKTGKSPVFYYYFTRRAPVPPGTKLANFAQRDDLENLGAFHTSDVPYVFGTLDERKWNWTTTDRDLSRAMQAYWIGFAKTGRPSGKGLPEWQPFDARDPSVMELGERIGRGPVRHRLAYDFFDQVNGREP